MTLLTCVAVRRRLPAFYDRELPIPDQIAVESHISGCPPCAGELEDIRQLGDVLRCAAAPRDTFATGLRFTIRHIQTRQTAMPKFNTCVTRHHGHHWSSLANITNKK